MTLRITHETVFYIKVSAKAALFDLLPSDL